MVIYKFLRLNFDGFVKIQKHAIFLDSRFTFYLDIVLVRFYVYASI